MQHEKKHLVLQQQLMQSLGFYFGALDGIWGPKCIEAKKRYESDPSFTPGIPNNGLPFGSRPPYPQGVTVGAGGALHHMMMDKPVVPEIVVPEHAPEPVAKFETSQSNGTSIKKK